MSEDIEGLKKRIIRLEKIVANHMKHSDTITSILALVRDRGVISLEDIRREFPSCYGQTQKRLYSALKEEGAPYDIIGGGGRGVKTLIIYLSDDDPKFKRACDYFRRISRRNKKIGTPGEIQKIYGITEEEATQTFEVLKELFSPRLKLRPNGCQVMLKEYYREYEKSLKATARRT